MTGDYDRAAAETYREVARPSQRDTSFAARTLGQPTPQWAAQHHAGMAIYPRCMLLLAFLRACALSLRGLKSQGRRNLRVLLWLPLRAFYPEATRDFVCLRVDTDHTSSISFVSVEVEPWSLVQVLEASAYILLSLIHI